jgi:hypothetical protein
MAPITPAIPTGAFEQLTGDIPDIGASVEPIGAAVGACAEPTGVAQFAQLIGAAVAGAFVAWPTRAAGAVGGDKPKDRLSHGEVSAPLSGAPDIAGWVCERHI